MISNMFKTTVMVYDLYCFEMIYINVLKINFMSVISTTTNNFSHNILILRLEYLFSKALVLVYGVIKMLEMKYMLCVKKIKKNMNGMFLLYIIKV